MLVCNAPELERWRPDFSSSEQPSPDWTRVMSGDTQLVNGLEAVEWDENPVQVAVCETCGYTDCAFGGYVHVSRAGSYVVWSEPRLPGEEPEHEEHQYAASAAIVRHGAVVVPAAVWASWPGVPALEALPVTRRGDLVGAWHASAPPREDAIGTDLGVLADALAVVEAVERWFDADPDASVGDLVPVGGDGGVTIFYDGPRFTEWTPAVRVGDEVLPVFAGRITVADTTSDTG
jgi:hypothetical protein